METAAQISRPEPGFRENIETLTRATATALVLVYAVGFIILALYDGRYGIIGFSFLRVKILSVGALFWLLVMLAAAAAHYQIEYLPALRAVYNNVESKLQFYRNLLLAAHFIYPATLMALLFHPVVFRFVLNNWWFVPADASAWRTLAIFAAFLVMGLGNSIIEKSFLERPKRAAFLGVGGASFVVFTLYLFGERNITNLTLFLFLAGLSALQLKRGIRYGLDFRNWFLAVLLIALFTFEIFGYIRPELGGGAPSPVTLYLSMPVAWLDSNVASVLLVDETDQGFYVLTAPTGKAFFLPRSLVTSVYFGTKADLPQKTK
jgi:hypothetical protein